MATRKASKPAAGWRKVLDDFLRHFEIDSKESGRTVLKPWGTQLFVLDSIEDGLEHGCHFFCVGKGRQYGVTSIMVPVDVLWALMHPGIEGAIIGHNPKVLEVCRAQINDIQARLPESLLVPLSTNSKDKMEWQFKDGTKSTIHLLAAGTTGRKTDLAKGHGLAFIHGTEVGEWGSETALNSLIASLAQKNPDRLYVFESTGEGNNLFARLYRKSEDHPNRRCLFVPWWSHDLYKLDKRTTSYKHYMSNPSPTEDEALIIRAAKESGHDLTDSELAWYRSMSDEMTSTEDMKKNYPSTSEDMFQLGGSAFFPLQRLNAAKVEAQDAAYKAFRVIVGSDISSMQIAEIPKGDYGADLHVWEEPKPRGSYCIAASTGSGGTNAVIQVIRCFADCVEQVAEFASPDVEPYQVAWVMAYLAGWYKNSWVNIDLQDGGYNIFREFKNMRDQVSLGVIGQDGIFGGMVFYLYQRIDNASGNARTFHWLSNTNNAQEIWIDLKDSFLTRRCIIHSEAMLEEMAFVTEGKHGQIGGDDECDDGRPFTMCIAMRTWLDSVRLGLIAENRLRASELRMDAGSAPATFLENLVNSFVRRALAALNGGQDYRRR